MQVIRLMDMPDKVIAFDELPEDLLEGLELCNQSSLPRHWREFIGSREKTIKMAPFIDPMTRQLVKCEPLVEKAPFAYIVYIEVNHDRDKWQQISNYVRRNAPKDFRLLDKIEDMAKPLAGNVSSEITLEPEDMVVIPLPKNVAEEESVTTISVVKEPAPIVPSPETKTVDQNVGSQIVTPPEIVPEKPVSAPNPEPVKVKTRKKGERTDIWEKSCKVCGRAFYDGRGITLHMRKHEREKVAA